MSNPLENTGIEPMVAETIVAVGVQLVNLIRSGGNSQGRMDALMAIAEEAKLALDREKFPGQ